MSRYSLIFSLAVAALLFSITEASAQNAAPAASAPAVQWFSWKEGITKATRENKKILLYVYTPSCVWCRKMERETFADETVAQLVKADFVAIKLNASDNAELEFKGKTYRFVNSETGGCNGLAAELLGGRMSFPAVAFLDETQQALQSLVGFKSAEDFGAIATYYGKNYYQTMPWSSFQKKYAAGGGR